MEDIKWQFSIRRSELLLWEMFPLPSLHRRREEIVSVRCLPLCRYGILILHQTFKVNRVKDLLGTFSLLYPLRHLHAYMLSLNLTTTCRYCYKHDKRISKIELDFANWRPIFKANEIYIFMKYWKEKNYMKNGPFLKYIKVFEPLLYLFFSL